MNDLTLQARGLPLHALDRGEGPLAVLLHGWLDHAHSFDLLAKLLPGRTVALDQRGHGDSAWVGPGGFYHLAEYVADLDCVLEALSPDAPVRLVGHSMGASVGLLYAAARPARVAHLTLLDGAPLTITPQEVPARLSSYLEDLRKLERKRRRVDSLEDAIARMLRFNPALTAPVATLLATAGISPDPAQGGALAWKWDPLLRAHSPLPFTEEAVQLLVAQVTAPVLAVRGERGFLGDEAELRARFPRLALEVHTLEAGHHLHLEAAGETAALVTAAWSAIQID